MLVRLGAALVLLLGLVATARVSAQPASPELASPWATEANVKMRLVAGPGLDQGLATAGIEIELAEGWKTYWRMPGTSGVPPNFDWKGSENTASINVLLPAPRRFRDPDGDTIGYKQRVVWPVLIKPQSPGKDVALALKLEIGVCKDICIPVDAKLELTIPTATVKAASAAIAPWLAHVPRAAHSRRPTDPILDRFLSELAGPRPRLLIEASYPGGAEEADLFIEAPNDLWVPLPKVIPAGADTKRVTFEIDLSKDADLKELKGKLLRFTAVGRSGASEYSWKLE